MSAFQERTLEGWIQHIKDQRMADLKGYGDTGIDPPHHVYDLVTYLPYFLDKHRKEIPESMQESLRRRYDV